MKQSVIISTYNQPEWLEKVLHGYLCQTFRDFEMVIADDGSDGRTAEVIERFRKTAWFPIQHVWHPDEGFRKCAILNNAILQAQADYLVFSDGDCVPRNDFLATHDQLAEPGRFLSGGYCKLPMDLSRMITAEDIGSGRAFSLSWLRARGLRGFSQSLKLGSGAARALLLDKLVPTRAGWNGHGSSTWKQNILEVNGHNEEMKYGGEDREMGERLKHLGLTGKRIRYRAILLHLDHARAYVNPEDLARNLAMREKTIASGVVWCDQGIVKGPHSAIPSNPAHSHA